MNLGQKTQLSSGDSESQLHQQHFRKHADQLFFVHYSWIFLALNITILFINISKSFKIFFITKDHSYETIIFNSRIIFYTFLKSIILNNNYGTASSKIT